MVHRHPTSRTCITCQPAALAAFWPKHTILKHLFLSAGMVQTGVKPATAWCCVEVLCIRGSRRHTPAFRLEIAPANGTGSSWPPANFWADTKKYTSLSIKIHTQPKNIKKKCMKVLHYQVEKWPVCLLSVCTEDCCGLSTPCATPNTMSDEYSPSCKQICQPIATGIQPAGHVPWLQQRSCPTFLLRGFDREHFPGRESGWKQQSQNTCYILEGSGQAGVRDLSRGSVSNIWHHVSTQHLSKLCSFGCTELCITLWLGAFVTKLPNNSLPWRAGFQHGCCPGAMNHDVLWRYDRNMDSGGVSQLMTSYIHMTYIHIWHPSQEKNGKDWNQLPVKLCVLWFCAPTFRVCQWSGLRPDTHRVGGSSSSGCTQWDSCCWRNPDPTLFPEVWKLYDIMKLCFAGTGILLIVKMLQDLWLFKSHQTNDWVFTLYPCHFTSIHPASTQLFHVFLV